MRHPHVRTILMAVSLTILLLPLAGVGALRIYDNELIRQTEAELVSQSAAIEAMYRRQLKGALHRHNIEFQAYGVIPEHAEVAEVSDDGSRRFRPDPVHLDIRNHVVLPPSPDPVESRSTDAVAMDAGVSLVNVLREIQEVTLSGIRIVDPKGNIVSSTAAESGVSIANHPEVKKALSGKNAHILRKREKLNSHVGLDSISRQTSIRVFVARPIFLGDRVIGAVVVSRTPVGLQKALYTNRGTFIGYLVVLLSVVLLISLLTTFAINQPVRELIRLTRRVKQGEEASPISKPVTAEFKELSESIVEMAQELDARTQYVQTFARNVSHEFKTPIASIRGAVELLEDHFDTMPEAKRAQFLENIAADTERMNRLVNRLHDLARAEVAGVSGESCSVVDALTWAKYSGMEEVHLEGDLLVEVNIAQDALSSVVSVLMENAHKYGDAPRHLAVATVGDLVTIDVWDSGDGISEANAGKVFDTFFTTGRDDGGTGLGLSIAKRLVEAHGGHLNLIDRETARFQIQIPRL